MFKCLMQWKRLRLQQKKQSKLNILLKTSGCTGPWGLTEEFWAPKTFWFSRDGSFCLWLLAVLVVLWGMRFHFFFFFQRSRLKEKDLIVLLFPFIQVWYSLPFLYVPFDACGKGSCTLVLPADIWGRYFTHFTSWLLFRKSDGSGSKFSSLSVDWKESLEIKELEKEACRQRGRTLIKAQDGVPWVERGLRIEGAPLGIHTAGLGRQPVHITVNFQTSGLGCTPWC